MVSIRSIITLAGALLLVVSCKINTIDSSLEIDNDFFILGISEEYIEQQTFETDLQKISFVTGVYLKHGINETVDDSISIVEIFSSDLKAIDFTKVLKDLECTNVKYIYYNNIEPPYSIVYFTPTLDLKQYLYKYSRFKKEM